jgi:hypothetical protein
MQPAAVHVEARRINPQRSLIMSFALTALAPRFPGVEFHDTHPVQIGTHAAEAGLLSKVADWCGTVPRHFPPVPPKGGDDGGWCGTVPRPLPGPIPPTPPQPWLDLGNAARSFR